MKKALICTIEVQWIMANNRVMSSMIQLRQGFFIFISQLNFHTSLYRGVELIRTIEIAEKSYELAPPRKSKFLMKYLFKFGLNLHVGSL